MTATTPSTAVAPIEPRSLIRAARARRVPGRIQRPDPRCLQARSARIHDLMRRRSLPCSRPPSRYRGFRPRTGSTGRARATVTRRLAPLPASTGTPSRKNSSITRRLRMCAVPGRTTSPTPPHLDRNEPRRNARRRRPRPARRARPDLAARPQRAAGLGGDRRRTSSTWASNAGTAPWSSPARAARSSPSRSPRAPLAPSTWPPASAPTGRCSSALRASDWTGTAPPGSSAASHAAPGSARRSAPHDETRVHHRRPRRWGAATGRAGGRLHAGRAPPCATTTLRNCIRRARNRRSAGHRIAERCSQSL